MAKPITIQDVKTFLIQTSGAGTRFIMGIPQIRGLGIGHRLPGDFKAIAM